MTWQLIERPLVVAAFRPSVADERVHLQWRSLYFLSSGSSAFDAAPR
jgi:hypothetical protein